MQPWVSKCSGPKRLRTSRSASRSSGSASSQRDSARSSAACVSSAKYASAGASLAAGALGGAAAVAAASAAAAGTASAAHAASEVSLVGLTCALRCRRWSTAEPIASRCARLPSASSTCWDSHRTATPERLRSESLSTEASDGTWRCDAASSSVSCRTSMMGTAPELGLFPMLRNNSSSSHSCNNFTAETSCAQGSGVCLCGRGKAPQPQLWVGRY
eukprot:scaffold49071_cov59-Phaeocystis_antarctica.AAC.7